MGSIARTTEEIWVGGKTMTHVGEAVGVGGDVEEEGGALEDVEDVAVLARVQQQIVRAVQVLHRRRQATRVVVCV